MESISFSDPRNGTILFTTDDFGDKQEYKTKDGRKWTLVKSWKGPNEERCHSDPIHPSEKQYKIEMDWKNGKNFIMKKVNNAWLTLGETPFHYTISKEDPSIMLPIPEEY